MITIETRLTFGGLYGAWQAMTSLGEFATIEDAEERVETLRRAMPMKDFRVKEIDDEDIPF